MPFSHVVTGSEVSTGRCAFLPSDLSSAATILQLLLSCVSYAHMFLSMV